jgi:hypothetical protein
MTHVEDAPVGLDEPAAPRWRSWLDRPLSGWWCALGWLVSTALYVAFVETWYGPTGGDSQMSTNSAWAIAHGQLACAYPPHAVVAAPVYLLLSGGIAVAARIGHSVPFPSSASLGTHCSKATAAYVKWGHHAHAQDWTLRIAFVCFMALVAGVVALLRTTGRGRRGWEPATLVLLACLPPLWMPLWSWFHPQDLLAVGLGLGAMACARRDAWIGAGVLIALAVLSQQFALLIAVPLLVMAPPSRRLRFIVAAIATVDVVVLPFIVASSGNATSDVILGSGNTAHDGGTLIGQLRWLGPTLFVLARVVPVVVSLLLSVWVVRRVGRRAAVCNPVVFVSLIALSLSLRLVFESTIYAYYFMAMVVALVVLEAVRGTVRLSVVVWLAVASLGYMVGPNAYAQFFRYSWEDHMQALLSPLVLCVAVLMIAFTITRRGLHRNLWLWAALALGVVIAWPTNHDPISNRYTTLDWQLTLVISGVVLLALPLRDQISRLRKEHLPPLSSTDMNDVLTSMELEDMLAPSR